MSDAHDVSRRNFLGSLAVLGAGAVWFTGDTVERLAALEYAHGHAADDESQGSRKLVFFTPEQAREVEAFAERIFPADDTPGARALGVLWFIDRGLTTFAKSEQKVFTEGLGKLAGDVAAKFPGESSLAALTPEKQDVVLKSIEETPFFNAMRFATLSGAFALPSYGGNRNFAGWKMIGLETTHDYRPPYGWYDRTKNLRALLDGVSE